MPKNGMSRIDINKNEKKDTKGLFFRIIERYKLK